ncbi:MAG: hypothetical protein AB7U73_21910 [Pirellulales bacterium]
MTLEPYNQQRIDALSLRVFDIATTLRNMARMARDNDLEHFDLHDKKALEWLVKLEDWAHKSQGALELAAHRSRGARRAVEAAAPPKKSGRKK